MDQPTTKSPVETLKATHAAFDDGDIETVLGFFDENIEWTTIMGTAHGRTAVQEEVFPSFAALLEEHDVSYQQEVDTYLSEGIDVVAFGRSILSKEGETIEVPFAQHCRVVDGKLTYGHGYHDTAKFFGFLGIDDPRPTE